MTERLSITIPKPLHQIIEQEAQRRGLSIAAVVREVLMLHYADRLENPNKQTTEEEKV